MVFPSSSVSGKESTCQWRRRKRLGFDPGWGRSPGEGSGNPLQYSYMGKPTDTGGWWAIVHEVTQSWTRLSMHAHTQWFVLTEVNASLPCLLGRARDT